MSWANSLSLPNYVVYGQQQRVHHHAEHHGQSCHHHKRTGCARDHCDAARLRRGDEHSTATANAIPWPLLSLVLSAGARGPSNPTPTRSGWPHDLSAPCNVARKNPIVSDPNQSIPFCTDCHCLRSEAHSVWTWSRCTAAAATTTDTATIRINATAHL